MAKFITGKQLKEALHNSKLTYCSYEHLDDTQPTQFVDDLADAIQDGSVVRLSTYEHIPVQSNLSRVNPNTGQRHPTLMFPPFKHYRFIAGQWVEVLRSHWKGPIATGEFSNTHGKISDRLARMFMMMIQRRATSANWAGYSYRDEMISHAITNLMWRGLSFNEAKSDNPFAYFTSAIDNSFKSVWKSEQRQQSIRDDIIFDAGLTPSFSRTAGTDLWTGR